MKKWFLSVIVCLFALTPLHAAEFELGVHYQLLKEPQPTQTGDQIEVLELFWYGCPHCYSLEPHIEKWLKNKPKNAEYVPLPAVLRDSWAIDARAFYTFEALGAVEPLHAAFFNAIHAQKRQFRTPQDLAEFAAEHGVDKKQFLDAYNSFAVDTKLRHAQSMVRKYETTGVPTIIVDGKYRATASMAGNQETLMRLVNFLVAKTAEERS
ncbi:MAG: thiol:disulfide interchange protein DsbA/DsbL [Gammaproteobacteria bacterium]|nr:thiol:disulfide interchange protein DsbA/DsbL [Gammaproteobacteria bacterium]